MTDIKDHEFLYDLGEEVIHFHEGGKAYCWADWDPQAVRHRKKSCVRVSEVGTSELCELCTGQSSKKRRRVRADASAF